jgi:hypothetical protein
VPLRARLLILQAAGRPEHGRTGRRVAAMVSNLLARCAAGTGHDLLVRTDLWQKNFKLHLRSATGFGPRMGKALY